jgi:hypothetical protein
MRAPKLDSLSIMVVSVSALTEEKLRSGADDRMTYPLLSSEAYRYLPRRVSVRANHLHSSNVLAMLSCPARYYSADIRWLLYFSIPYDAATTLTSI